MICRAQEGKKKRRDWLSQEEIAQRQSVLTTADSIWDSDEQGLRFRVPHTFGCTGSIDEHYRGRRREFTAILCRHLPS